jgi:hypothetical protein
MDIGQAIGGAFGGVGKGIGQLIVITGKVIPYLIGGGIVAFIAIKILEDILFYKHKVRLKKIVGNTKRWYEDKAREIRLKNGAKAWHLKKLKLTVPIPPDNIILLDNRGKLVAEGYLTGDNYIFWGRDDTSLEKIQENLSRLQKIAKDNQSRELTKEEKEEVEGLLAFEANFQPVSTNAKIIIAEEMKRKDFGKKDITHLIEKIIPWAAFITMLVLLIFGFKYYAGPLNDYGKEMIGAVRPIAELNKQTAEYMYAINRDVQIIKADLTFLKGLQKDQPIQNDTG